MGREEGTDAIHRTARKIVSKDKTIRSNIVNGPEKERKRRR
jgi:hypothetical protein